MAELSTGAEVSREELHFRRIDMRGWRRSDGLFEVEGRVIDQKPGDFVPWRGGKFVAAGESVHNLGVRLVFDDNLEVREVSTFTDAAPYAMCPEGGRALQALVGLRMVGGWNKQVRTLLAGAASCTHLMELLTPMATVAHQSIGQVLQARPERVDKTGRPIKIDSCYAYGAERELVLRHWPEFHRPGPPQK